MAHDAGVGSALAHGVESGDVAVTGDVACVKALLDEFDPMFNVVEP